jgi:hypothetical protein
MLEFTSEPQKTFRPVTIFITLGVLAVLLGALFFYVHYQSGLQKNGTSSIVVAGLLRPGNTDFEYYKNRILIQDVKGSLGITFNNTRIAMISGTIINDGDRKLEAVEARITLYDAWGDVSKERTAFLLRPGAGFSSKPMEPLESRTFSIGIESVEYYWDPKEISWEITGLKYQ